LPLTQRARARENGEKKREQWRRGQITKVSCVVSMYGEAKKLSVELYMGLKKKKK